MQTISYEEAERGRQPALDRLANQAKVIGYHPKAYQYVIEDNGIAGILHNDERGAAIATEKHLCLICRTGAGGDILAQWHEGFTLAMASVVNEQRFPRDGNIAEIVEWAWANRPEVSPWQKVSEGHLIMRWPTHRLEGHLTSVGGQHNQQWVVNWYSDNAIVASQLTGIEPQRTEAEAKAEAIRCIATYAKSLHAHCMDIMGR